MFRFLPPGAARRATDLRRSGADGQDGRRGAAVARRAVRLERPERGATTAVFYSISNCQPGLRGVSLGNFLIKNVVDVLSREFPRLKVFCTLSPVPEFRRRGSSSCSKEAKADDPKPLTQALKAVAAGLGTDIAKIASDRANAVARLAPLKEPLTQLCATYLLHRADDGEPTQDPVARFHLNNGAKLERINWLADISKKGPARIAGPDGQLPVRARGDRGQTTKSSSRGEIVASRQVRSLALGD